MESKASILGHPIHPILVSIPIGLWTMSLVSDLAYLARGELFWYDAAWWTMAFGIVGALAAAVPGLIDFFTIDRDDRAHATARAHMVINLVVVAAYAVNAYLRYHHAALLGGPLFFAVALSVLSFAALGCSGWLGGELVYRFGMGMKREVVRVTMLDAERETTSRH